MEKQEDQIRIRNIPGNISLSSYSVNFGIGIELPALVATDINEFPFSMQG